MVRLQAYPSFKMLFIEISRHLSNTFYKVHLIPQKGVLVAIKRYIFMGGEVPLSLVPGG